MANIPRLTKTDRRKGTRAKQKAKAQLANKLKLIKVEKLMPDTSAIINRLVSQMLESKKLDFKELILHRAMLAELEYQANQGRESGHIGLEEIKLLTTLAEQKKFILHFEGSRPTSQQIKYAKDGEIDASIRELAQEKKATLLTSDTVQAEVGKAIGMDIIYIPFEIKKKSLAFVKYCKPTFMSLHLKENEIVIAKSGVPGAWEFTQVTSKKLAREELEEMAEEIVEKTRTETNAYLEIERPGSIIAQVGEYRIVITRPPFAAGWEITVVRPIKKMMISEYNLSDKLRQRVAEKAEGVLIAGSPGHGKSTFIEALAKDYVSRNKLVKVLESPRSLQLPDIITRFAIARGTPEEIRDIILLTRPDYTLWDEMRNPNDFRLFADLRLAGVGMVGVVHATDSIDAIQRFIGKIELGMIPHIIDTVIFIKNGKVDKVLGLKMKVKVPYGMTEEDLARPVVEVFDFESGSPEYEIYTFGEATSVVPVGETREVGEPVSEVHRELRFRLRESRKYFLFYFITPARKVDIVIDNVLEASLPLQRGRELKVFKTSQLGRQILDAFRLKKEIRFE